MKILDFCNLTQLAQRSEAEKATLLCYYHTKESNDKTFSMANISELLINAGFNAPNCSRLRYNLIKGKKKAFLISKQGKGSLEFIPAIFQSIDLEFGLEWENTDVINSNSEIVDETKFCGKRSYLDRLIHQINSTYYNNCYDACAVLLRRLFEVMLILSFQNLEIDDQIKDKSGNGYLMLEGIINNAINNQTLKLSRIKKEFDTFRLVGNFSAHNITYTAGKKDIDDIKINYRVMLEELYNKSGLIN
ncbi:hypothetical protein SDC9_63749 [bioreactor metagenome]|uniref:DUF4145 domain-containing protein n=1 Tax=bioreactor metagenome TaxID=1076179 RepID=A0A644XMG2_9ZZZZ